MIPGHAVSLSKAMALAGQMSDALDYLEQTIGQPNSTRLRKANLNQIAKLSEIYYRADHLEEGAFPSSRSGFQQSEV